ncbi:MAG: XRE family transcriptional regulator [Gaiellales bacterium]|nr:MAG: XRE family transcriptional regulator [Gaiellales bacterium]
MSIDLGLFSGKSVRISLMGKEEFAKWLDGKMKERKPRLKKSQLAVYLGVDHASVANWLKAQYLPELANIEKIASLFHVDPDFLQELAGIRSKRLPFQFAHLNPRLRAIVPRIAAFSSPNQDMVADLLAPVVAHIERDERIGRGYRIAAKTVSDALETVSAGVLPQQVDSALRLLVAEYEETEESDTAES